MNTDQGYGSDLCKNHSARSEKEFCRVCPSNLNKKELENLYFTLLENNLDLKKTINNQREKIKILSTKVQRLTALQKAYLGKQPKECCGCKALIIEQKESISELKRSNQCLSERVRQLNMRLCSAKQFLKRSPFQSTSRCNRCSNKNVSRSASALITKRSETDLRNTATSSQYLVKDIMSSRTADNVISHEKGVQYDLGDENKCRNLIEELKKKNDDLEGELSRMKQEHVTVTSQWERDVCELRAEGVRARSDRTLAAERAERLQARLDELTRSLATADLRCDELVVQLAAERRAVRERDARLRAADMSARVASVIQTHLDNVQMIKDHTNVFKDKTGQPAASDASKSLIVQSPPCIPKAAVRTKLPSSLQVDEGFNKSPDDSGYTEVNRSQDGDETKASTYVNQVLLEKIADLQNQINSLKAHKLNQEINAEKTENYTTLPEMYQIDENLKSESSESVITEKKMKNIVVTQETKNYINNGIEAKTETINQVSKITEVYPEHEGNKIEDQQCDSYIENNLTERFKHFKRRSKELNRDSNGPTDSRKLSLQSSRELIMKTNLIKTGSLDENKIIDRTKEDSVTRFEVRDIISDNKIQINKSNNDIVANIVGSKSSKHAHNKVEKESDKKSRNKADVKENNTTNRTNDENKKESDSSNGTYTIEKDEKKLNTGPKNRCPNPTAKNKNYNNSYTAANIKKVFSNTSKDKLVHQRKCTASEPRTYTKASRDVSPESTECEISSMSDLPSERDARVSSSRSPGEERAPTASESCLSTAPTTDYGSLSEGELPYLRDATVLSDGEKRLSNRRGKSHSVPQMEQTLAAVQHELARCSRLLRGRHD